MLRLVPWQVLVHGEASVMGRLRLALQSQYADSDVKIHTPRNCEPLTLTFNTERVIKVRASLSYLEVMSG